MLYHIYWKNGIVEEWNSGIEGEEGIKGINGIKGIDFTSQIVNRCSLFDIQKLNCILFDNKHFLNYYFSIYFLCKTLVINKILNEGCQIK